MRLSGTTSGIKYRLGVANPFDRRKPELLNQAHLQALRVLLGFVEPSCLGKRFEVCEPEFARRFRAKDALPLLKALLLCWVRTTTSDTTVVSRYASVTFYKTVDRRTIFVTFSDSIIPVLRRMMSGVLQSRPRNR